VRLLRQAAGALIALVILFEEWGWDALHDVLALVGRLPPLAWLERRIAALPPYAALAVFAIPALALLPVKLVAVWLIAGGHALAGLLAIVVAKVVGTAVVARLFALTRPALMRMAWFARLHARWLVWKNGLLAQVRASAPWRAAAAMRRRWQRAWQRR